MMHKGKAARFRTNRSWPLYLMLLPSAVLLLIFSYFPMYGIVIAFQDFNPALGFFHSPWAGMKWFNFLFDMPSFKSLISNTLVIACSKVVLNLIVPVTFALLLNEVQNKTYKKSIQTMVYLPHFLSWVIAGGIFIDLLSTKGLVNQILNAFGMKSILFLGDNRYFQGTVILTDVWKEFGWGAIIYLAALTNINPNLYESAMIDGAGRFAQAWHITLPGIRPTIILMMVLALGNVLNAGQDQILVMYSPVVYRTGDIIDTFVYRQGLLDMQFSLSTAVGLFKSAIGFVLIVLSNYLANRFANYRIF